MSVRERRERDRASREQLIVTAARELAEAEGWDAVTVRHLAERVEYSQPVLYSHFAGKAGIVRAVALEGFGELAAELRHARTAAPGADAALRAVAAAYLRFAQSRPAVYDAMFVMPTDIPFAMPETPAAPRAKNADVPPALSTLIMRMLAKNPLRPLNDPRLIRVSAVRRARCGSAMPVKRAWPAFDERTRQGRLAPSSASA